MTSISSSPTAAQLSPEWLLHTVLHQSAAVQRAVAAPPTLHTRTATAAPIAVASVGSDSRVCVLTASVPHDSAQNDAEFAVAAVPPMAGATCVAFDASNSKHVLVGCLDGTAHVVALAAPNGNKF